MENTTWKTTRSRKNPAVGVKSESVLLWLLCKEIEDVECLVADVADALVGVGLIINSDSMPGVLMLDKDYNNMSKFLNRILGMPVELQNRLFKYFTDTLQAIITQAKKSGRFDLGILGQLSRTLVYFAAQIIFRATSLCFS